MRPPTSLPGWKRDILLITDLARHSVTRQSVFPQKALYRDTILHCWNKPAAMMLALPLQTWTNTPSWNGSLLYVIACGYKKHLSWRILTHVQISQEDEGIWNHKNLLFWEIRSNPITVCRCSPPHFAGFTSDRVAKRTSPVAARLLELRVRIPRGAWLSFVNVVFCAGRGLCVGPIPRPEDSYRLWCVWVYVCVIECGQMQPTVIR